MKDTYFNVLLQSDADFDTVKNYVIEKKIDLNTYLNAVITNKCADEFIEYALVNNVDISNNNNWAVYYSITNGYFNYLKLFKKYNPKLKLDDDLSIKWAAQNGHGDCCIFLIENGADPKIAIEHYPKDRDDNFVRYIKLKSLV